MRLPPLAPSTMTPGQRALHEAMAPVIAEHLKGFVSKRSDGALVGPFPPMLHFLQFGQPAWDYTRALIERPKLPKPVREVAILVTGACFNSRYELYAHEHVAEGTGPAPAKIAAIAAGQRPADLSKDKAAAYDVAIVLAGGKQLPGSTYAAAIDAFGQDGVGELVYLISGYCLVSVLLNAFDMSVPGSEEGLG